MDTEAILRGIGRVVEELNEDKQIYRLQSISGGTVTTGAVSSGIVDELSFVQIHFPITGQRYAFRSHSLKEAFAEAFAWAIFRRAMEAA